MLYTNLWQAEDLYRRFFGGISGDEILESNFELHTNPNFKTIKYIINDFIDVTAYSIENSHTKAYASSDAVIANSKGKLNIALVVDQDELIRLAKDYRQQMIG